MLRCPNRQTRQWATNSLKTKARLPTARRTGGLEMAITSSTHDHEQRKTAPMLTPTNLHHGNLYLNGSHIYGMPIFPHSALSDGQVLLALVSSPAGRHDGSHIYRPMRLEHSMTTPTHSSACEAAASMHSLTSLPQEPSPE